MYIMYPSAGDNQCHHHHHHHHRLVNSYIVVALKELQVFTYVVHSNLKPQHQIMASGRTQSSTQETLSGQISKCMSTSTNVNVQL